MTPDQQTRLVEAVDSFQELVNSLHPGNDVPVVEEMISVLSGHTSKLKEEPMARTKGAKNKANSSSTPPVPPQDITELITQWRHASAFLAKVKDEEHALRQAIVSRLFDSTKLEGTEYADIGWGWQLRLSRELAYNATNENHETEQLLAIVGTIDPGLAQGLIRWKPDVAKKVYREMVPLAEQYPPLKEAMAKAITLKPGMPQLEMVPPKTDEPPVTIENVPA